MKRLISLLSLVLVLATAGAQPKAWTVTDCIDYALEHNITLKQTDLSVQQSEIQLSSARAAALPGASAGASESFDFGRGLTSDNTYTHNNTTMTSFSVGAQMPLFQGFTIRNNIALSRLNLEAATVELEKARDDIRVAVAQAYVQILYNMEVRDVAQRQTRIDSLQVVRLEALTANGKASAAEVSAQQATLAQSRYTLTQAEGNLRMAILDLTQLLELPSPEGFTIARPAADGPIDTPLLTPDDIFAEAMTVKPSIRSEQIRLKAAEKSIDIARGGYLPSLSLSGGFGSAFYSVSNAAAPSFGTQLKDNFSPSLGLSLSIPLFSRFSTRNNVRSARLSYQGQQLQLENAGKTLYKEIQQAYQSALGARANYEASLAAERSAQQAFDIMNARYENSKASITEWDESKNRLMRASSDLAQARYQYLYQTRLLDFYRGHDIAF